MNSLLEKALNCDRLNKPIEAIKLYEQLIQLGEADCNIYINLAIIYFECFDLGYAEYHKIPEDIRICSLDRALELLELSKEDNTGYSEKVFWVKFIKSLYFGDDEVIDFCQESIKHEINYLLPYFYLFAFKHCEQYKSKAYDLYKKIRSGETEKERYIRSILQDYFEKQC
jgi:tetratricopeptide (TPR) repeat protein